MKNLTERLDKHLQNIRENVEFKTVEKFLKSHKNIAPTIVDNISDDKDSLIKLISSALNNSKFDAKAFNDLIEDLNFWVIDAPYSTEKDNPKFFEEWRDAIIRVAKELNIPVSKIGVIKGLDEEADMYDYYKDVALELPSVFKVINTDVAKKYEAKLAPYVNKVKSKARFVVNLFDLGG